MQGADEQRGDDEERRSARKLEMDRDKEQWGREEKSEMRSEMSCGVGYLETHNCSQIEIGSDATWGSCHRTYLDISSSLAQ